MPDSYAHKRSITRDGRSNILQINRRASLLRDAYHFLLVATWARLLMLITVAYLTVNALFATLYVTLAPDGIAATRHASFADAFAFSVQTLATIGYGNMAPITPAAHFLVTIEALVGLLGFALITGLIFSKFARPTARVMFSRAAVMTTFEGKPALMFRMANERSNHIVEAHLHVVAVMSVTTAEGTWLRRIRDLKLVREHSALFNMSWTAVHIIEPGSPFHGMREEGLRAAETEIIVSLTGLDDVTMQQIHARFSYVAEEIRWNARLADIVGEAADGRRQIDYKNFHETVEA